MKLHIGYVLYGILSLIESLMNLLYYVTFIYKFAPVFDFAIPVHFWYTNKFCKRDFIERNMSEMNDINEKLSDG